MKGPKLTEIFSVVRDRLKTDQIWSLTAKYNNSKSFWLITTSSKRKASHKQCNRLTKKHPSWFNRNRQEARVMYRKVKIEMQGKSHNALKIKLAAARQRTRRSFQIFIKVLATKLRLTKRAQFKRKTSKMINQDTMLKTYKSRKGPNLWSWVTRLNMLSNGKVTISKHHIEILSSSMQDARSSSFKRKKRFLSKLLR